MKLPIYIFLMLLAAIYDVVQVVSYSGTNWILFCSGVLVLFITLIVAILQTVNAESWELKWMLLYTIPAALLLFGSAADYFNLQNHILVFANQKPIPSLIPGTSADYRGAVISHFVSMTFPIVARALSVAIEFGLVLSGLTNRSSGRP
ncbi:MAG: hypothetical protein M0P72_08445 [Metallibacterium scheffleri]|jgi:hypothetical protein|uniref:hypothetical protein n=1 Tax=Metallibacterium scheffleri TaxID=993689 RepID=UPI0026EAF71B|nr:hypothetical protein [Metallibacterium scheffleri]MCK9367162.1 hypothetical protein [Metallibacterium scheffleri]